VTLSRLSHWNIDEGLHVNIVFNVEYRTIHVFNGRNVNVSDFYWNVTLPNVIQDNDVTGTTYQLDSCFVTDNVGMFGFVHSSITFI
jgi:hypothetical protein